MDNVVLPFLLSMLLGRTIDLTSYTMSGVNVYDDAQYNERVENSTKVTFNVLQEDVFPYTFFGIPADIVLRIKSNLLSSSSGAMGLDGVLKDNAWKYNSVVVSVTTVHRTVDRTLKPDAQPLSGWSDRVHSSQTHFVRTLFYGGWSVILFKFQCEVTNDVKEVRRILTKHLGVVGPLERSTIVQWDKAIKEIKRDDSIRGTVKLNIHVYSTTPFHSQITSPDTLIEAIEHFPEDVGPIGQPLFMELKPLTNLDDRFQTTNENIEMLSELEKLDFMFDDVKITKNNVMRWMTETSTAFEDEDEEKISSMLHTLNECIKAFNHVGAEVSLFKIMHHEILDTAFQKYLNGLEKGVSTYNHAYRRLREEIDADCQADFQHKIKGLLRVYDNEMHVMGKVKGGLQECQKLCVDEESCRSVGYAERLEQLDLDTGLYLGKEKQCWIYFRSTSTASVYTPNGFSGDIGVYDRNCY